MIRKMIDLMELLSLQNRHCEGTEGFRGNLIQQYRHPELTMGHPELVSGSYDNRGKMLRCRNEFGMTTICNHEIASPMLAMTRLVKTFRIIVISRKPKVSVAIYFRNIMRLLQLRFAMTPVVEEFTRIRHCEQTESLRGNLLLQYNDTALPKACNDKGGNLKKLKAPLMLLIILSSLLFLSGCNVTRNNVFAPNKRIFGHMPDATPLSYRAGWQDGCETGLATGFANDYYKTFYQWQKDIDMVKAKDINYLRAWSGAMAYCRHYALGTLKEAGLTPKLPGERDWWSPAEQSVVGNLMEPSKWGPVGLSNW